MLLAAASTTTFSLVRTFTHWFGLEWGELELRGSTCTTAGPHARPLTFAFGGLLRTTGTAGIFCASAKRDWEVESVTTATTTAAAASPSTAPAARLAALKTPTAVVTG